MSDCSTHAFDVLKQQHPTEHTCHIAVIDDGSSHWYGCSECHGEMMHWYKWCPSCGAKVQEVD